MPRKIDLNSVKSIVSQLKDSFVIKAWRGFNTVAVLYFSVKNPDNGRTELWYLNSHHSDWKFYDSENDMLVSFNSSLTEIDTFFMANTSFEIFDASISDNAKLKFSCSRGITAEFDLIEPD